MKRKAPAMIVICCKHETRHKHGKDSNGQPALQVRDLRPDFRGRIGKPARQHADHDEASHDGAGPDAGRHEHPQRSAPDRPLPPNAGRSDSAGRRELPAPLDTKVKNVEVKDVQLDEIWSFVGMKEKHPRRPRQVAS